MASTVLLNVQPSAHSDTSLCHLSVLLLVALCRVIVLVFMALCCLKVVHRATGEVMVVKQLLEFDREAQESFLKEVGASVSQVLDLAFVDKIFFHSLCCL